jgi:hypothetical protein
MSPADQSLVRHVERVRHQRLVDWGVRAGPIVTRRSRLFQFFYDWGGHLTGVGALIAFLFLGGK